MIPALIGAGSSLLGGILGRNAAKKATARQNEYNKPINMRARAEEGGFNPLLWAGQGNLQTQVQQTGQMGNALANAGLAIADGMSEKRRLDIEKSRLKMDRERLDHLIQQATIRPKTGGIYASVAQTPSIKKTGSPLLSKPAGVVELGKIIAPGREQQSMPVTDGPGVTILENAGTFGPVVIPGADGEPWGIDEVATAVVVGGPQVMYNGFKKGVFDWSTADEKAKRAQARSVMFPKPSPEKVKKATKKEREAREWMKKNPIKIHGKKKQ